MPEFGPPPLLTAADFEAALRRNFDDDWIGGLLADPSSRSVFAGAWAVMLRLQTAIDENISLGAFILTGFLARSATCTVTLTRPSGAEGSIATDRRFVDERGFYWRPTQITTVPASVGVQSVDVVLTSERKGHWLNTYAPLSLVIADALFDPNLVVAEATTASDGRTGFLEQHAAERAVLIGPNETEEHLQGRLRFIEDVVSPLAMIDVIHTILGAAIAYQPFADMIDHDGLVVLREPFDDGSQSSVPGLAGTDIAFQTDGLFFDDPLAPQLRSSFDDRRWLDIYLPTPIDPDEARPVFDDGLFLDDPLLGFLVGEPGINLTSPIALLVSELNRRRAGGVRCRIIIGETMMLKRHPTGLDQAGDWTDQDGAVTALRMTQAVGSYDADDTFVATDAGAGAGATLDAGDLLFEVDPLIGRTPLAIHGVELRARCRRRLLGQPAPELAFVIEPAAAAAPLRVGGTLIESEDWLEVRLMLDENPDTATAWTPADVIGLTRFGIANVAVGATDELRVSELRLEVVADYG